MRILVLLKAVPVVGAERLDPGWRTARDQLEANGADEYPLERALQLAETHGADVALLTLAPAAALDALRKALAMGAARAYHVCDPAVAGSDIRATIVILEAVVRRIPFDLLLCGADTSDGQGGIVGPALAARLGLPYLSSATTIEPGPDGVSVRITRATPAGADVLEAPLPAVVMGTQLLGAPRYPSLRGIMAARAKEIVTWTLADLGVDPGAVGSLASTTCVTAAEVPPPRAEGTILRGDPAEIVPQVLDYLAARGLLQ